MIDTHCHLTQKFYSTNLNIILKQSLQKLNAIITIGTDYDSTSNVVEIAAQNQNVYAAIGIHPEEIKSDNFPVLEWISHSKVVAVGEIGLDYHYPETLKYKHHQIELFISQIEVSIEQKLPIIIHSRDAFEDTITILKKYPKAYGVWHSFTGAISESKQILDLGYYIGINGIVTFPSAGGLREAIKMIPLEKLLLETDAPLLAPVPFRGSVNYPWMVQYVAETIAQVKDCEVTIVDQITTQNAKKIFNLTNV